MIVTIIKSKFSYSWIESPDIIDATHKSLKMSYNGEYKQNPLVLKIRANCGSKYKYIYFFFLILFRNLITKNITKKCHNKQASNWSQEKILIIQ